MNRILSNISSYKIVWLVFTPESGHIIRRDDIKIIQGTKYIGPSIRNKAHFRHFQNKERAKEWLRTFDGSKLKKAYRVRMCYDVQFGKMLWPEWLPKFTRKQEREAVIIGNGN